MERSKIFFQRTHRESHSISLINRPDHTLNVDLFGFGFSFIRLRRFCINYLLTDFSNFAHESKINSKIFRKEMNAYIKDKQIFKYAKTSTRKVIFI